MKRYELPTSPTKDIPAEGIFRSVLIRWVWRLWVQRLTRGGKWFLLASLIIGGYGSFTLQFAGLIASSYVIALWLVAAIAMLFWRPRATLTAHVAQRISVGETLMVDVDVHQHSRTAADLVVIPHRLPDRIDAELDEGVRIGRLERDEHRRVRVGLKCGRRGAYMLRGFRIESDYPFGLFRTSRRFEEPQRLLVYPKFRPLAQFSLPTGRRYHPGGVALASTLGESMEYLGNREYREGDNIRDIDWRATGRIQRPIVREYREEYLMRVAVILDTYVAAAPSKTVDRRRDAFERAVSLSASVADYMARQDYLVDLFAAGPNLFHLTAGRSLAYLDQILDILACVEENPAEPFGIIEPQIMELLSKITLVICVFLDWDETRQQFVQRLREQGAGVKVIIARDGPCTLDPTHDADVLGLVPIIGKDDFAKGVEEL